MTKMAVAATSSTNTAPTPTSLRGFLYILIAEKLEVVRRGYSVDEIAKIWSGHALRVWSEAEPMAGQAGRSNAH